MDKPTIKEVEEWVKTLYDTCEQTITDAERAEQRKYAIMVQRPQDKKFLVKMLDESSQIRDRRKLAKRIKRLIDSALADQFAPEESGYWYYYITSWYDNVGIYTFDGMSNFSGSIEGGQLSFDFEYADDYNKEDPDCSGTCTFVWNKGVSAVQTAKTAAAAPQGVYTISGVRVADSAEVLSSLPAGLYVVNGKVVVK